MRFLTPWRRVRNDPCKLIYVIVSVDSVCSAEVTGEKVYMSYPRGNATDGKFLAMRGSLLRLFERIQKAEVTVQQIRLQLPKY